VARRELEKLPPDRLARLSIGKLASLLDCAESTIYDATTWQDNVHGCIRLPATPPIPVQRSAENGHAFVWRRHLDRAVDAAYRADLTALPLPDTEVAR
jgi:hypothetical protein